MYALTEDRTGPSIRGHVTSENTEFDVAQVGKRALEWLMRESPERAAKLLDGEAWQPLRVK